MNEHREEASNNWRQAALGAVWVVLVMVVGWIATDARTANVKLTETVHANQQRLAIVEEAQRNKDRYTQETLRRIEANLDEVRREVKQLREDRRR